MGEAAIVSEGRTGAALERARQAVIGTVATKVASEVANVYGEEWWVEKLVEDERWEVLGVCVLGKVRRGGGGWMRGACILRETSLSRARLKRRAWVAEKMTRLLPS